ncbi:MAG: aminotransferase class I/II-fold pyridoxal phosphate-dependent enzyme, partial [Deltaproteobacteria bacterium]|nr:aminotransferase class I/II-fold pyridoxal phosphate-dependent enzyme [Deltaproteobacteria bacterium]
MIDHKDYPDYRESRIDTQAIHAGRHPDPVTGAVSVPIYQSSTFAFDSCAQGAARFAGTESGYIYSRMGNPTVAALEEAVSTMEGGQGGLATASGMAATCTVAFTFLGEGLHMIGTDAVYGPTRVVMERDFSRFGVQHSFVDTSDIDQVKAAIRPNTRLLFIESPANPTLKVTDLAACAEVAKEHGIVMVVDNTFASPVLQRPLSFGANIVVHSLTKFINGHTDVVGGMIVCDSTDLRDQVRSVLSFLGGTMDPHAAWLALRGSQTLPLRVRAAQQNAQAMAELLEGQPKVAWVRYPGLASHPQHELASRQMDGPGALISVGLTGGHDAGVTLLESLRIPALAVSLGGIETLVQHPASMTHATMTPEA